MYATTSAQLDIHAGEFAPDGTPDPARIAAAAATAGVRPALMAARFVW